MYLGTGHSFRLRVDAAATTTESTWYVGYKEKISTGLGDLVAARGVTTGTSNVTAIAAIASGEQAEVVYFELINADTVSHTYTIEFFNGTSAGPAKTFFIGVGERLEYSRGTWSVITATGLVKSGPYGSVVVNDLNTVVLASPVVNNNATPNTIQDVTGLQFPVIANEVYWFQFQIAYTAAATTTGSRWSISGPSSPTIFWYMSEYSLTATTTTRNANLTAYDLPAASNATSGTTGSNQAIINGVIQPSSDGNVIARFASEVANSAITALAGSRVQWQRTL